jgi:hypothetical protein
MSVMSFFKVETLPETLVANAIYFVPDIGSTFVNIFVTDSSGQSMRSTVSTHAIRSIAQVSTTNTVVKSVATFSGLSELDPLYTKIAFVIDASGDSTVKSGAATYIFNTTINSWVKVAEFESMDVSLVWANILDKPNSTPTQIDNSVLYSHHHANKNIIDRFDLAADGTPTYTTTDGVVKRIVPNVTTMRYFNATGEITGELVTFVALVKVTNGIWSVNYSHVGFKTIVDYQCSGVYRNDSNATSTIPSIDSRSVTTTGLNGYAVTRIASGLLAAMELTKSNGDVKVTVVGTI